MYCTAPVAASAFRTAASSEKYIAPEKAMAPGLPKHASADTGVHAPLTSVETRLVARSILRTA